MKPFKSTAKNNDVRENGQAHLNLGRHHPAELVLNHHLEVTNKNYGGSVKRSNDMLEIDMFHFYRTVTGYDARDTRAGKMRVSKHPLRKTIVKASRLHDGSPTPSHKHNSLG